MIVVFGSLNADLVFRVKTSPRPGETVLTSTYDVIPGGKGGNQAFAAARAGADVRLVGCVGEDGFGRILLASLASAGVDVAGVRTCDVPTGCAAITVDAGGENMITVAGGANFMARADDVTEAWIAEASAVMLQMEVTLEENWSLAARARRSGRRIILNAAPAMPVPSEILPDLDILIVNEIEARTVAQSTGVSASSPVAAASELSRRFGFTCVVTLGAKGAFAFSGDDAWHAVPPAVDAVDTTGAGDAFCGVLAASIDQGMDLPDSLRRAVVGGSLACTRKGAQTGMPQPGEIDLALMDAPAVRRLDSEDTVGG
jgi:ribokinase